ncbi:methyltransferase domain-containing protein [Nanoarchaeota archaeon]
MDELRTKLRDYLNIYWLRPEAAIWRVCDWLVLKDVEFKKPILDLACGDGLNSYTLFGNKLPSDIDDSVSTKNVSPKEFFEDYVDIYNDSEKEFPEFPEADFKVDVGLDWKQGLLDKARKLNFYDKLIQHDANLPLPLEEKSFNTIFSNSLYWLKNIDSALAELHKVLKDEGKLILILANPNMNKYNIYNMYNTKWSKFLNRGRTNNRKSAFDIGVWNEKFEKAGFKVDDFVSYIHPRLTLIQEVGLRPISPVIIKMAHSIPAEKRAEIKKDWIDYTEYVVGQMFEEGFFTEPHDDNCYYRVVLSKK